MIARDLRDDQQRPGLNLRSCRSNFLVRIACSDVCSGRGSSVSGRNHSSIGVADLIMPCGVMTDRRRAAKLNGWSAALPFDVLSIDPSVGASSATAFSIDPDFNTTQASFDMTPLHLGGS